MAETRAPTYRLPPGNNTTIIQEGPARSAADGGWLFGIVLLIAVLAVGYLMAIRDSAEAAPTRAIAAVASGDVDLAARQIVAQNPVAP